MGGWLLSHFSSETLSSAGFDILIIAMLGEVAVWLVPDHSTWHKHAAFAFAALAVAGYTIERVGDDAIIAALEHRATVAEAKSAPRKLVPVQQTDVAGKVSKFKDKQFFGQVGVSIPDGRILWASVVKALQDGGWQLISAEGATGTPPASDIINPQVGVAVFVVKDDADTAEAAGALMQALRDAGLKEVNGGYSDKPDMAPNRIKIAIGTRPAE
jgi:hypothetical protein